MQSLGDIIKKYRLDNDLSLREFSKKCGLSHTYIDKLEKGVDPRSQKPVEPTLDALEKLSYAIELSLDDLLTMLGKINSNDTVNINLSNRLKLLRNEKNVMQKDIANYLNITMSAYGFYEQGKRTPPPEILSALAEYFDVSVDYLIGRVDTKQICNKKPVNINENEKDVEELLEETMSQILDQKGLMLNGQIVDDNDLVLLRNAIRNGIELAKTMQKSKK
ncbi:MAG: helix-turn-helix domain-containing protein [Paraclostridium sordellii]